ncbi:AsnC family transcriptional regulator [Cystobacter fuscus]|uniref:AsnC family transcriptional regulator n=1 Tax=Cystobacter fuscus TaxID=43 RepID=A0A250J7P4_9BACT|nr:AsnC family transcriptional regulator [Cystobacter fuscus]
MIGWEAVHTIFVMIKCELGQTYKTAAMIADQVDEAAEVYSTSGGYDLLAKFHLDKAQDVGRFVTERIQTMPGIKDTYTITTFSAF